MDLITISEASEMFDRSVQTLNKMVRRGKFTEYRVDGQRAVSLEELADYYSALDEKREASETPHSEYCNRTPQEFFARLWEVESDGQHVATLKACCYLCALGIAEKTTWSRAGEVVQVWEVE